MAAASDRGEQIVGTGKLHGVDGIDHPGTAGNQAGVLVDAGIPNPARRVVTGIARSDDLPVEITLERLYEGLVDSGAIAPLQPRHVHVRPPLEVAGRWRSLSRARYILIASVRDRVTSVASQSSATLC